ncbi:hypothetical protein C2G38_2217456 [Gigaspora rosea]|uniref:DUF659 domain-containing protein n=1 Tax=Gigaspora rosea TaxID=44941 RepID=A0A397U7Q6_9GLOM|nr:hypothetical protein C2G38_2217456 [Gigaspora rosea]
MVWRHTGGPEKHRFTNDIIVLGTKPTNKHNTYGVYKACDNALGRDEALKRSLTNKKNTIRNHLKKCEYFLAKLVSQELVDVYCNRTDNEEDRDDDSMSDVTTSSYASTSTSTKIISKNKTKKPLGSIANFIVRTVTSKKKPTFEQLLLRMTISNGWSFRWTSNPATLEFYEFLNPNLTLPDDKIGVTLIFDGWKNILKQHIFGSLLILSTGESLIWKTIDISLERDQMIEIIPKIESMISEATMIGAKLTAVVSDSAPAYASTSFRWNFEMWEENNDNDNDLPQYIILRLEQRWKQWEQPLLLLGFLLNPNIRKTWFNTNTENLNFTYLARHPFDRTTYEQFGENVLGFWKFASSSTKELGPLAVWLFGISVKPTYSRELIKPNELNDPNKPGKDEHSDSDSVTSDSWESRLGNWEQLLEDEEVAKLEEEEVERENNNCNVNNDLLSSYIHLAVDPEAK